MRYKTYRNRVVATDKNDERLDAWGYQDGKSMTVFVKIPARKTVISLGEGFSLERRTDERIYDFKLKIRDLKLKGEKTCPRKK